MVDFDLIINRVCVIKDITSAKAKDVASVLGISPQDFSNRKKRGTLLPVIVDWALKESVNLNWLLKGETERSETADKLEGLKPLILDTKQWHGVLHVKLQRVLDEGDKVKLEAIKGMLKAFDPGEKKQGLDCTENEKTGPEYNRAA